MKSVIKAFLIGVLMLGALQASALTLSPSRLEVGALPGERLVKEITVLNDTQNTETYYVSYANFEAQGETGTPLFVDSPAGLASWMNAGESVTLAPGESKDIPLVIDVPGDAYAGGYFAAVFFGNNPEAGSGQVSVGAKTGVLVLLSVRGDVVESGGLITFETIDKKFFYNSLPVSFLYRFKNEGTDRVKPEGKIIIRNLFFIPVTKLDANPVSGNILPGSTRMFKNTWIKKEYDIPPVGFFENVKYQWQNFALGLYSAQVKISYGSQNMVSKDTLWFFVFPWQLFIIIIIILFIIFWILRKLITRYNRYIIKKAQNVF